MFSEWKQIRPRNEALDCLILALAACRLAGPLATGASTPPDSAAAGRADGKAQDANVPLPSDSSHVAAAADASASTTAADTAAQVFAAMMAARAAKSRGRR